MRDEWVEQSLREVACRNHEGFVLFYPDQNGGVNEFELVHFPISRLNVYMRDKGLQNGSGAWKALKEQRSKIRNRADFTTGMSTSVKKQLIYLDMIAASTFDIAWQAIEHMRIHKDCPFIATDPCKVDGQMKQETKLKLDPKLEIKVDSEVCDAVKESVESKVQEDSSGKDAVEDNGITIIPDTQDQIIK